jgi:hypothetical protein
MPRRLAGWLILILILILIPDVLRFAVVAACSKKSENRSASQQTQKPDQKRSEKFSRCMPDTHIAPNRAHLSQEASVPGGVLGDQKAQKVVTKYVYTEFSVRDPFFQCVCKC